MNCSCCGLFFIDDWLWDFKSFGVWCVDLVFVSAWMVCDCVLVRGQDSVGSVDEVGVDCY